MKFILVLLICLLPTVSLSDTITIDGTCNVYYSPKGGVTKALVDYINTSKSSIKLLAYNFTSVPIAQALIVAKTKGVDVQVILDKSVPTEKNSALPSLKTANISIWIDRHHAIAHNKVIIVDNSWIETGSFNYSTNAEEENGENALICPSISGALSYSNNFELHKSHSLVYK